MALEPASPATQRGRVIPLSLYIVVYIVFTSVMSVILARMGYIPFDQFTALVLGIFAGCAFGMVQITYIKFIARSSRRIRGLDY